MDTLEVKAGNVVIGGEKPIVVQTMCNTHTYDVDGTAHGGGRGLHHPHHRTRPQRGQ